MWLGSGVVLLILLIVIIHHTECTDRLGSYARYSQSRTTRRSHIRTTTYKPRTTRRSYPITTTPRPHRITTHRSTTRITTTPRPHRITTYRATTRTHVITTTPSWTTRRTTLWSRPLTSQWTTTTRRNSHIGHINTTRPLNTQQNIKPVNTTIGNGYHTTRQPPSNPFFSSSTRPILNTTQHIRPLGTGVGNGSHTTRQPAFNPFFSTTSRPILNTTQHIRPLGKGVGNGSRTTRQPASNPFFSTSSRPILNTTHHNRPVFGNGSQTTRQPSFNPSYSTMKPHSGSGPSITTPVYKWHSKTNVTSSGSGTPSYPGSGIIIRRNQSAIYHGPGVAFNHSNIIQRPTYNASQGITSYPGYPVSPINPVPPVNNHGYYQPGGGYYPSSHPQQQPHVTIVNNNINTHHHVIYPSKHWNSYGPPASGVTIINNNNNFDFYHPPTTYRYSTRDTGSSTLGFYLGYLLGKLTRPSYHYHGTYYEDNRYVPRYDHYVIHHYDHQRDSIPKEAEIPNNIIVTCDGDSGSICPRNTVPLCTNNAVVMCVTNAFSTTTCEQDKNLKCVKSSVPCEHANAEECRGKSEVAVSVPCISTAKIQGIPNIINNTIVIDKNVSNGSMYPLCVTVLASPTEKNTVNSEKEPRISVPFHYTTNDTGTDTLGIYLGQTLEKLEYPSYVYLNYDSNMKFTDTFDHYSIHHYYHEGNIISNNTAIYPNSTISCVGDSGSICPQNSSSLCFSDGGVACLTDVSSTIYNKDANTSLVLTTIPCTGSKDPACHGNNSTIPLIMPCMSVSKIYANTSYLINSVKGTNGTIRYYKTINIINNTSSNGTNNSKLPIPREFCVTILLLPKEKSVRIVPKLRRASGLGNAKRYLSLPKYLYSTKPPSGNKTLDYYLVQRLDSMRYPSFYFVNGMVQAQDGTIQLYDHLSVHHYYDSKEIIPDSMNLQSSSMVACPGDSGIVCPTNTSVLCLYDGSIMCVTDLLLTEPCSKSPYCVKSTLPCKNVSAPKCKKVTRVHVTMPCISTLTIHGDITSVNNSVYQIDKKNSLSYVDLQPINNANINIPGGGNVRSQLFCVSIVLLPEIREVTEGEKAIDTGRTIFANFVMKIFGIA